MYKKYVALLALVLSFNAFAQSSLWTKTSTKQQIPLDSEIPRESLQFQLQKNTLLQSLSRVPSRLEQQYSNVVIDLPNEDGTFDSYQIFEASNFHPELAARYPEIKSYIAKGISKDAIARISYAPSLGFSVAISNFNTSTILIKAVNVKSNSYSVFSRASMDQEESDFECETIESAQSNFQQDTNFNRNANDSNLRLYRAAITTTGEFSQFFLDGTETTDAERRGKVLAAINQSLTRINGIFERDFSVTMQLIPNNDVLIYLNGSTDPFGVDNFTVQNTIDTVIGDANYDVGHLFAYEGAIYGNAGCIACVCTPGSKGQAYTVHSAPDSDNFNMIASHEYGHQFGGWHVQSSANCRSSAGLQEVEPGSGSTIMGYAGICSPNVQAGPDDYFNYVDIRDVAQWTINDSSCAELIGLANNAPTANAGDDYTIPRSTAFVLEGQGSDQDNDVLSFCWEENDPENPNSTQTPQPTWVFGPMFRSKLPVATPDRYMPQLSDVVAGNLTPTWEMLPSVSRTMDFVITVRDNALNGGQTASDEMTVTVTDTAGPFVVTSQSTDENWNVGENAIVTWDVANTNVAPVNATEVDIYLSTDGGFTYPHPLALGVMNDGSETISIPNVPTTTQARVMVRGTNSIFYAINAANFEVQASEFVMNFTESNLAVCKPNDAVYNFTYNTFLDFNETTTFSALNLPDGAIASFNPSSASNDDTSVTLTISNTNAVANGTYDITVNGLSATAEKSTTISLEAYESNLVAPTLLFPENNASAIAISETFTWENDDNAATYDIEIASDNSFSNIILAETTEDSFYDVSGLEYNTTYYWRVSMANICGTSDYSTINELITFCVAPTNLFVDNILTDAATINWTENGNATSWEVEIVETGIAPTGSGEIATTNPYTVSGLNLSTGYDVYVRSICGGGNYSGWVGPSTFSTQGIEPPGILTAELTNPDQGQVTLNWSAPSDFTGSWFIFFDFDCLENWNQTECIFNEDGTFLFPAENLEGDWTLTGDQIVFTFDNGFSYFGTRNGDFMEGMNDANGCWYGTKINNNDPLEYSSGTINVLGQPLANSNQIITTTSETSFSTFAFIEYNVYRDSQLIATTSEITYVDTLPDFGSYQYYVTAVYDEGESDPTNTETIDWISCPEPTNLAADNAGQSTIDLSWINGGSETSWEIEYGLSGFVLGTGTVQQITTNPYTLNGLDIATSYDVYLRANCGANPNEDDSNWIGPVTFTTQDLDSPGNLTAELTDQTQGEVTLNWGVPSGIIGNWMFNFDGSCTNNYDQVELIISEDNTFYFPDFDDGGTWQVIGNDITFIWYNDFEMIGLVEGNYMSGTYDGGGCWFADKITGNNYIEYTVPQVSVTGQALTNYGQTRTTSTSALGFLEYNVYRGTQLIASTTETTYLDTLPDYGIYEYYVTALYDEGESDPSNIATVEWLSCPEPTNLVADNTTSDSTDLSWFNGGDETAWEIEYGFSGFTLGNGTILEVSTNPYTLSGLDSSSNYEVYLRANCGANPGEEDSAWVGPIAFTTLADFCSGDNFYDSGGASGNYQNGEDITTVISPSAGSNTVTVTFNSFQLESCCDYLRVYDGLDINAPFIGQYNGNTIPNSFTANNPSGALTFRFTSDGSVTGSGWDATVTCEFVSCPDPIEFALSNITPSSVDLGWIAQGSETSWELEYGISGFTLGTGTVVQTSSNPYTLEGLEVLTAYDVYLRANCGSNPGEDDSNWIGPLTFITQDLGAPGILTAELTNQAQGEVTLTWGASNFVGNWVLNFDHDCNNNYNQVEIIFNEDGSFFIPSENNGGTWEIIDDQITWTYDGGFQYTGTITGSYMEGTMGTNGCWFADKISGNNYIEYTIGALTSIGSTAINVGELITIAPVALDFIEFNIYRNNQLIASTTETTYVDTLTSYGVYEYYVAAVYDEGESEPSNIEIVEWESLGIETNTLEGLKLYPNPVNTLLNISYTQNITKAEVFSILGQKVMSTDIDKPYVSIDLSAVEAGTYFIKVWVNERSKVFKIVKD